MNPFMRAHRQFVLFITYPSKVRVHKQAKKKHFNMTCALRGHPDKIDFKTQTKQCSRCGREKKIQ